AELRARVAGVRVELGVGPGPGELARSRSGPQARICAVHDAAVDTDDAERRIGGVGTAALRIRDVVTDRGRRGFDRASLPSVLSTCAATAPVNVQSNATASIGAISRRAPRGSSGGGTWVMGRPKG